MVSSALALMVVHAAAGHRPDKPKLRAPEIALTVSVNADFVSVEVTNNDTIPLTLVADAHLLALDITPMIEVSLKHRPTRPKTIRCNLPVGIRPSTDAARQLVIPPGSSYKENVDARFLCFTPKEHGALAPHSIVVARLGFVGRVGSKPKKVATKGFAVVRDPSDATAFPLAEIVSAPSEVVANGWEGTPSPHDIPLAVELSKTIDVATAFEAPLQVSLKNQRKNAQHIRLKPEALRLTVFTPEGRTFACDVVTMKTNPMREFYSTLGAKGKVSFAAALSSICPRETFESQGLYRMIGTYETSQWAEDNTRAHAFSGTIESNAPNGTWIRIREGKHPMHRREPTLVTSDAPRSP